MRNHQLVGPPLSSRSTERSLFTVAVSVTADCAWAPSDASATPAICATPAGCVTGAGVGTGVGVAIRAGVGSGVATGVGVGCVGMQA